MVSQSCSFLERRDWAEQCSELWTQPSSRRLAANIQSYWPKYFRILEQNNITYIVYYIAKCNETNSLWVGLVANYCIDLQRSELYTKTNIVLFMFTWHHDNKGSRGSSQPQPGVCPIVSTLDNILFWSEISQSQSGSAGCYGLLSLRSRLTSHQPPQIWRENGKEFWLIKKYMLWSA